MPDNFADLTPDDIGDNVWIEGSIEPRLTQNELALAQLAQSLRQPGPGGGPLYDDRTLLAEVFKHPHPEEVLRRVAMQNLEQADPETQQLRLIALRQLWREAHPEVVALAEQPQAEETVTMTKAEFQKAVQVAAELKAAQAAGMDPNAVVAGARAQSLALPTAQPYREEGGGPNPSSLPTQMGGAMQAAPQPMEATPDVMADQMRRGRPQP